MLNMGGPEILLMLVILATPLVAVFLTLLVVRHSASARRVAELEQRVRLLEQKQRT